MILFSCGDFEGVASALRERVPQLRPGEYKISRFDNGELGVHVETPVKGEPCFVLGSIAPPDTRLTSTLLLAHTLRKEGAHEVIGVMPYLAYSRQDKNKPGESLAAAWIGASMQASGFDRVITIDVHSGEVRRLFPSRCVRFHQPAFSPAPSSATALSKRRLLRRMREQSRVVRRSARQPASRRPRFLTSRSNGRKPGLCTEVLWVMWERTWFSLTTFWTRAPP